MHYFPGAPLVSILSIALFLVVWLIDTGDNVHVCADASMFSSYQATGTSPVLMGNGSHAIVRGVGMVDLKFTSGKTVRLKNVHHVPSINKNLLAVLVYVEMVLSWFLSPIKL